MLSFSKADCNRCGGFLSALTETASEYLHGVVKGEIRWVPDQAPDRFIVHKAPHLDEYLAEFLFRASEPITERRREFLEMALYSEDDSGAKTHWPHAVVFGMGADMPCGNYAEVLFDEHIGGGGRKSNSCTDMVTERCFDRIPAPLERIVGEVSAIDSVAGAHELHLNNMLKTCHLVQYTIGRHSSGRLQSGKLTDSWKRAVVNALLAAVVYCLERNVDILEPLRIRQVINDMFDRFSQDCPYRNSPQYDKALARLRGGLDNPQMTLMKARVTVKGQDLPQVLVAPFLAVAAQEAWGTEIAYFLMVHFWESEVLKNLHFQKVTGLLGECLQDRQRPRLAFNSDCSVGCFIVREKAFKGKRKFRQGGEQDAKFPSPLWILSCRHNNFILQPNKAMLSFIREENFGIGLVFSENTKEATKVLFKGSHVPDPFWNTLVERIQDIEPNLWVRPQPTAPFIVNGNAAHQYVELSSLTAIRLAKLCRAIH